MRFPPERASHRRAPRHVVRVAALALAGTVSPISAQPLPGIGPIPADRYAGLLMVDTVTTQSIRPVVETTPIGTDVNVDPSALPRVLDELYGGSVRDAVALRNAMPPGSADRRLATWTIALSGKDGVPLEMIDEFVTTMPDWPGQGAALDTREAMLLRDGAVDTLARLGTPRTQDGKLAVARHLASATPPKPPPCCGPSGAARRWMRRPSARSWAGAPGC